MREDCGDSYDPGGCMCFDPIGAVCFPGKNYRSAVLSAMWSD